MHFVKTKIREFEAILIMAALVVVGRRDIGTEHHWIDWSSSREIERERAASGQPDGERYGRRRPYGDGHKFWCRFGQASFSFHCFKLDTVTPARQQSSLTLSDWKQK
jgi:hypothetical protein